MSRYLTRTLSMLTARLRPLAICMKIASMYIICLQIFLHEIIQVLIVDHFKSSHFYGQIVDTFWLFDQYTSLRPDDSGSMDLALLLLTFRPFHSHQRFGFENKQRDLF